MIFVVTREDLSTLRENSSKYMQGSCRKVSAEQIDTYFESLREEIHPFIPVTASEACWDFVQERMMEPIELDDACFIKPDDVLLVAFFEEDKIVGGVLSAFDEYTN